MPTIEQGIPNVEAEEDVDINKNDSHQRWTSVITNQKRPHNPVIRWLKQTPKHYLCKHECGCASYVLEVSFLSEV